MEKNKAAEEAAKDVGLRQIHPGTAVTRRVLDKLGSPDDKLKIIHIAGTNGKGSTAEYLTRILIAAGKRTGTFTSPAAYSYGEQFRVDGEPIPGDRLDGYLAASYSASRGVGATPFETETAAAIYAFVREGCEYAVVECGMGGRDDSTNAVNKKLLAIITSVSLEHTDYLGSTIEEICAHKTGIIRDCPSIACPLQTDEAADCLKKRGVRLAEPPSDISETEGGQTFRVGGERYKISMAGYAQPYNAATAVAAAKILKIGGEAVKTGLERACLKGRIELIEKRGVKYVLDGAHNPASFYPLAEYLKRQKGKKTVIFGCLSDKDADANLAALCGRADKIIAVRPPSPRAMDSDKILRSCKKYFADAVSAESVSAALCRADGEIRVVCGSFTLLKEAKEWIEKR